ncbi:MAG: CoA transferase [Dehalococcoidia bacterium]
MTDAALSDIRILDLAGEMGVYATKLLADLGADVIRIEPPAGDPLRAVGPFFGDIAAGDRSLSFFNLNTNKRSLTLDIASPEARPLFEKLAATADIVVETFPPGYLDALGLGYAGLCALRPDIILTSVTGFGQDGPHAGWKAYDITGVAMSGMMTLAGEREDPPNRPYGNQGYIGAGIQAAAGTMMALVHRDNTGTGQHVDVSMQEALSINQETAMQTWDMTKTVRQRTGGRPLPVDIPGIGVYEASDGHIFAYLGTPGGAPWPVALEWMVSEGKAEDLVDEPNKGLIEMLHLRFLTQLTSEPEKLPERLKILAHIHEVFGRFCASMSKWKLYEEGQKRRLMVGIVSTPEDLAKNPQLAYRKWFQEVPHDHLSSTVTYAGPPYRLSETPWSIARRPPLPGEHNAEIFKELAIPEPEIARLRGLGVV